MAYLELFMYIWAVNIVCAEGQTTECPSGYQWDVTLAECVPCPTGYYRTKGSHDRCVKCPDPDYITTQEGATSEKDCDMPVRSRARCPSGTEWFSQKERCVPCTRGSYRTKGVHYWCVPCTQNRTTPREGATSSDECIERVSCPVGTSWNDSSMFCEPCPRNTYSNGTGSDACTRCPFGHVTKWTASTSASQCLRVPAPSELFHKDSCPSGTEPKTDAGGSLVCTACPVNTYRTSGVHDGCVPCPVNTTTWMAGAVTDGSCLPEGSLPVINSSKPVIVCPPGTEWRQQPVEGCYLCPRGTYKASVKYTLCLPCPSNSDTPAEGTIMEALCGSNVVTGETSRGIFIPDNCPPGTEWTRKRHSCVACSYGYYRTSHPVCEKCPDNRTTLRRGATSIDDCKIESIATEGAPYFSGEMCPKGSEFSSEIPGCVSCPRGFYKTTGQRQCLSCPKYYTTLTEGSISKTQCLVPTEGPATIPTASYGCPEGYQLSVDSKHCSICPLGTYKPVIGPHNCTICPIGDEFADPGTSYLGAVSSDDCVGDVVISDVEPSWSLQSVSVEVAIQLSAPSRGTQTVASITVGSMPCNITRRKALDGRILCFNSPSREAKLAEIVVELLDGRRITSSRRFTYRPDPIIDGVQRTRMFVSGGIAIQANGDHFRSVDVARMTLRQRGLISTTICRTVDDNLITCDAPNLTPWIPDRWRHTTTKSNGSNILTSRIKRMKRSDDPELNVNLGFVLGDLTIYDPLTPVLPQYRSISVHPDPDIDDLPGKSLFLTKLENPTEITLTGSYLNSGALLSDYSISVGNVTCSLVSLTWNDITCRIRDIRDVLEEGEQIPIEVSLGSLRYNPGSIIITKQSLGLTGSTNTMTSTTFVTPTSYTRHHVTSETDRRSQTVDGESTRNSPAIQNITMVKEYTTERGETTTNPSPRTYLPSETSDRSKHSSRLSSGTTEPRNAEIVTQTTDTTSELDTNTATFTTTYLIPLLVSVGVAVLVAVVIVVIYFEKKRQKTMAGCYHGDDLVSVDNLLQSMSSSGSETGTTVVDDASLPPLPVESVFGPERRTDRGISQRSLAFPPDTLTVTLTGKRNKCLKPTL